MGKKNWSAGPGDLKAGQARHSSGLPFPLPIMSSAPVVIPASEIYRFSSSDTLSSLVFSSSSFPSQLFVIFFTAAFYPPCDAMSAVCSVLIKENPQLRVIAVEAEEFPDVSASFKALDSVPTFFFLKAGKFIDQLAGPNAPELTAKVALHIRAPLVQAQPLSSAQASHPVEEPSAASVNERIDRLLASAPVMIFIKGTPEAPRCGFTKKLLTLLKDLGVHFSSFDILSDNSIREGLKIYKNWPTFPQIYINGELIGGLDIVTELHTSGEFLSQIPASCLKSGLNNRLKELINESAVMIFMKGSPDSPQCGFSRQAIALLRDMGVEFGSFDILSDSTVREGLKEYSNWPTYPQLYANGELIGGLDIMKELRESGELIEILNKAQEDKNTGKES